MLLSGLILLQVFIGPSPAPEAGWDISVAAGPVGITYRNAPFKNALRNENPLRDKERFPGEDPYWYNYYYGLPHEPSTRVAAEIGRRIRGPRGWNGLRLFAGINRIEGDGYSSQYWMQARRIDSVRVPDWNWSIVRDSISSASFRGSFDATHTRFRAGLSYEWLNRVNRYFLRVGGALNAGEIHVNEQMRFDMGRSLAEYPIQHKVSPAGDPVDFERKQKSNWVETGYDVTATAGLRLSRPKKKRNCWWATAEWQSGWMVNSGRLTGEIASNHNTWRLGLMLRL